MISEYGSGSCFFLQLLSRCQQKTVISKFFFFCLLLSVSTSTLGFQDGKPLRSLKNFQIRDFLNFFLHVDGRIQIRSNNYGFESWSGRPKILQINWTKVFLTRAISKQVGHIFRCHHSRISLWNINYMTCQFTSVQKFTTHVLRDSVLSGWSGLGFLPGWGSPNSSNWAKVPAVSGQPVISLLSLWKDNYILT